MDWLTKARWHSEQLAKRTFHRQLRLGVTGLSGAGKNCAVNRHSAPTYSKQRHTFTLFFL